MNKKISSATQRKLRHQARLDYKDRTGASWRETGALKLTELVEEIAGRSFENNASCWKWLNENQQRDAMKTRVPGAQHIPEAVAAVDAYAIKLLVQQLGKEMHLWGNRLNPTSVVKEALRLALWPTPQQANTWLAKEYERRLVAGLPVEPGDRLVRATPAKRTRVGFYQSDEWKAARFDALKRADGCCTLCGRSKRSAGVILHVDHIKPRSKFPDLELVRSNLQVFCEDCNLGKGNRDTRDWREDAA